MKGTLGLLIWSDTLEDPTSITPLDLYNIDEENKRKAELALAEESQQLDIAA